VLMFEVLIIMVSIKASWGQGKQAYGSRWRVKFQVQGSSWVLYIGRRYIYINGPAFRYCSANLGHSSYEFNYNLGFGRLVLGSHGKPSWTAMKSLCYLVHGSRSFFSTNFQVFGWTFRSLLSSFRMICRYLHWLQVFSCAVFGNNICFYSVP
jgi:hypothetical protein